MAATLDTIETALWTALAGLLSGYTVGGGTAAAPSLDAPSLPTNTRPLRHLRRFAGEFNRTLAEEVDRALYGLTPAQFPAALLTFVRATPLGADGAFARPILGGERMTVARSIWRVFVATGDLRGDAHAMKSDVAGQPAARLAATKVAEGLHGLAVAGLLDEEPVAWMGTTVYLISRRGLYVMSVDVSADFELGGATTPTPGSPAPLETIEGQLGPPGDFFDPAHVTTTP